MARGSARRRQRPIVSSGTWDLRTTSRFRIKQASPSSTSATIPGRGSRTSTMSLMRVAAQSVTRQRPDWSPVDHFRQRQDTPGAAAAGAGQYRLRAQRLPQPRHGADRGRDKYDGDAGPDAGPGRERQRLRRRPDSDQWQLSSSRPDIQPTQAIEIQPYRRHDYGHTDTAIWSR